ncbi:MAG: beta-galactosidase [Lachnospiraceae bacterium]|nr:beta-galactosidase [Lachnospiraceae bacterium]
MNSYVFGKPVNKLIHGGDYNPEQWLSRPDILEKDIEYMKQAGINEATLGVFSWAMYEPKEGEFHFDWLVQIMDNLYQNGISTILATPSAARPVWLDHKYPEVMRVDGMGNRNRHGFRHNHCMSSELYREKVSLIIRKLAEAVGDHPGLLMWHISNEFGGECYCDKCKSKFQEYLRRRFHNDIEELNHEWWTTFWSARYSDFSEIEPPYNNGQTAIMGLNLEWKRFTTRNYEDYMSVEIDAVRAYSPKKDIPITTNFMGRFYGIDYRVLAKKIDAISWDSYPAFHNDFESYADTMFSAAFDNAIMKGMKKDKPFLLMESAPGLVNWMQYNKLKRPGVHEQFAVQTIASGSDSVQYFQMRKSRGAAEQFHGALIDHIGTNDTRIFKEVAKTGEVLSKLAEVEGSLKKNEAAVIFEWDNWWAIDGAGAFSRNTKKYDTVCRDYWVKLMEFGVEPDVISTEDSLDNYKLVIVPMLFMLKDNIAQKLTDFVEKGGILLVTYITGYVNENCLCYQGGFPGDGLSKLVGVISEEIDTLYPSDRNGIRITEDDTVWEVKDYAEILRVADAEVLGRYTDDFYKDMPALTCKKYGPGKAYYQAARCSLSQMDGFFEKLLKEAQVETKLLPAGIEYHRRYGKDSMFEFYLNLSEEVITLKDICGENMISGEQTDGSVVLEPKGYLVVKRTR